MLSNFRNRSAKISGHFFFPIPSSVPWIHPFLHFFFTIFRPRISPPSWICSRLFFLCFFFVSFPFFLLSFFPSFPFPPLPSLSHTNMCSYHPPLCPPPLMPPVWCLIYPLLVLLHECWWQLITVSMDSSSTLRTSLSLNSTHCQPACCCCHNFLILRQKYSSNLVKTSLFAMLLAGCSIKATCGRGERYGTKWWNMKIELWPLHSDRDLWLGALPKGTHQTKSTGDGAR